MDQSLMKRIVIDGRELKTSSGRYVERLLNYLAAIDQNHEYKVLLKPIDLPDWQVNNPNFEAIPCPHKEFTFDEQIGLLRQVKGLKADLVHFTFAQQPIWYKGPVVTTFHDLTTLRFTNPDKNPLVFKLKQAVYARVIKQAARKSTAVIVPSQFVKNDLAEFSGVNPDKITVTYEAAEKITDPVEPMSGLQNQSFIMYVGRPTPHKNLERLVQAFVRLKQAHPELYLVLVGQRDSNYERLETSLRSQGIKGVFFTGEVSEGRLRWLYENCAVYIFPSLSEGFGLPGLEAMAHGAPVAASNVTSLPEIYGAAAQYFDPEDEVNMAEVIGQILGDEHLRLELIAKGRGQVKKYSWQKMAEQTLTIYKRVLGEA